MNQLLLSPPAVFIIILIVSIIFSKISGLLSMKGKDTPGKYTAYACGEDIQQHKARPDYSEFFPLAFFFTIMHVVVLIIATVPSGLYILPILYIVITAVALFILFRK